MIDFKNARMWSLLGPNGAFGIAMQEIGEIDLSAAVLTADLRFYSGLNRFAEQFPDRFFNMGIAEENMLGVAAGMAKEGMHPFVTTYATFASLRCADQLKVNMGYMKLPVKLVGLGAGFSAGILGSTHIAVEDVALIRAIPNVDIISPADCAEVIKATLAVAVSGRPAYLRLTGGQGMPPVYKADYDFQIGKAVKLREGTDVAIIATGSMVYNSLKAAELLSALGISASVVNMHTIRPLDISAVKEACKAKLIVTAEEHSVVGGLGSAVAEYLAPEKKRPPHLILGAAGHYPPAGSYKYMLEHYGLTPEGLADSIAKFFKEI